MISISGPLHVSNDPFHHRPASSCKRVGISLRENLHACFRRTQQPGSKSIRSKPFGNVRRAVDRVQGQIKFMAAGLPGAEMFPFKKSRGALSLIPSPMTTSPQIFIKSNISPDRVTGGPASAFSFSPLPIQGNVFKAAAFRGPGEESQIR